MSYVKQMDNPAEFLPLIFANATGREPWSGLHVSGLSEQHIEAISAYCTREGWRQGWNDALYKRVSENGGCPFHPDLMDGVPYQEWERNYRRGVEEQQQLRPELPTYVSLTEGYPDCW